MAGATKGGQLKSPSGLTLDVSHYFMIAESMDHRVRKWMPHAESVQRLKQSSPPAEEGCSAGKVNPMGVSLDSSV